MDIWSNNKFYKGKKVKIVSREEWGAQPPKLTEPLTTPVKIVAVYPETGTQVCYDKKQCIETMKKLQQEHFDKKYPDVQYNFLVGMDGRIYEGRGWNTQSVKMRRHPKLEGKYISIAYIGNFEDWIPPYRMTLALRKFIKYAVENKYIDPEYRRGDINYYTNKLEFEDDRGEIPV